MLSQYGRMTRVEVDLGAIRRNVRAIKSIVAPTALFCAVVKADAYGHGAVAVARAALDSGADYLAVAILDEAMVLRDAGFTEPMLIMGASPDCSAIQVVDNGLTQAVYSMKQAQALSAAAGIVGRRAKVHLKIDIGMGRLWIDPGAAVSLARDVMSLPHLEVEGIFTNLTQVGNSDPHFIGQQLSSFLSIIEGIEAQGVKIPLKHCANSAATLNSPKTHLDMVRVGISLYGLKPSAEMDLPITLVPAMCFKTKVCLIKTVSPGIPVSYGGLDIATTASSNIATLPVGYADGWFRSLGGRGRVLIGGQSATVVGNVCVDQCLVDITGLSDVSEGDDVLLFGGPELPVEEVAEHLGTINYEVVCMIGKRVSRIYWRSEEQL